MNEPSKSFVALEAEMLKRLVRGFFPEGEDERNPSRFVVLDGEIDEFLAAKQQAVAKAK
jgi:hypothetical protein